MGDASLVALVEILITRDPAAPLPETGIVKGMLDNLESRGANREAAKGALQRMVNRFRNDAGRERAPRG